MLVAVAEGSVDIAYGAYEQSQFMRLYRGLVVSTADCGRG